MLQVEDLEESDMDLKLILEMYTCESIDSRLDYHIITLHILLVSFNCL